MDGYETFEKKRTDKGGGLANGFHNSLEPFEICDEEHNEHEILVVEVKVNKKLTIRFITAYGPQEPSSKDELSRNQSFFNK